MASSRTCASSDGQHVTSQHVTSQHVVNSRHRGMHADVHGSIEVRRVCTNAQAPCRTSAAPSGRSTQVRQPHPIVCILGPTALCDAGEPLCPPWCSSREPTHLRLVWKAIDSGETVIPVPPCKPHQRHYGGGLGRPPFWRTLFGPVRGGPGDLKTLRHTGRGASSSSLRPKVKERIFKLVQC